MSATSAAAVFPRDRIWTRWANQWRSWATRAAIAGGRFEVTEVYSILADRYGNRPLFHPQEPLQFSGFDGPALTGRDLQRLGNKIANALRAHPAIERNARVVIAKRNHPDYLLYLLSTIAAGGIPISVNAAAGWDFIAGIQQRTGAVAVLTDHDTLLRDAASPDLGRLLASGVELLTVQRDLQEVPRRWPAAAKLRHFFAEIEAAPVTPPPPRPLGDDTPVAMFHTSGTTGVPKCCVWDRRNLTRIWKAMMLTLPAGPGSRCLLTCPFSHALYFALQPGLFFCGVPTHGMSDFEPGECLSAIDRLRITHYLGFPYTYMRMAAEDLGRYSLASMRIWSTGADKAHAAFIAKMIRRGGLRWGLSRRRGSIFLDSYGSTEIGAGGILQAWFPGSRPEPCVQGKPLPTQFDVRIVDERWTDLPRGEVGRILVKSTTHFAGYWNDHDAWSQNRIDGWWWGGDVGRLDAKGRLHFLDREVDVVRTRRGKLYTLPVEEELLADDRIMEAAVFQRTADPGGQTGDAVAWVVPRGWLRRDGPGPSPEELAALRRDLLARANRGCADGPALAAVETVPLSELPLGLTGKVLKRRLRALAAGRPAAGLAAKAGEERPARAATVREIA